MLAWKDAKNSRSDVWHDCPPFSTQDDLERLSAEMSFDEAVDLLAKLQRSMKYMSAWCHMAHTFKVDGSKPSDLAEVPLAEEALMGVWINNCSEREGLWLLRHQVPCYIIYMVESEADRVHVTKYGPSYPLFIAATSIETQLSGWNSFDKAVQADGGVLMEVTFNYGLVNPARSTMFMDRSRSSPEEQGYVGSEYCDPRRTVLKAEERLTTKSKSTDRPPLVAMLLMGRKWSSWEEEEDNENGELHLVFYDRDNCRQLSLFETAAAPLSYKANMSVFGLPTPDCPYYECMNYGPTPAAKSKWMYLSERPKGRDTRHVFEPEIDTIENSRNQLDFVSEDKDEEVMEPELEPALPPRPRLSDKLMIVDKPHQSPTKTRPSPDEALAQAEQSLRAWSHTPILKAAATLALVHRCELPNRSEETRIVVNSLSQSHSPVLPGPMDVDHLSPPHVESLEMVDKPDASFSKSLIQRLNLLVEKVMSLTSRTSLDEGLEHVIDSSMSVDQVSSIAMPLLGSSSELVKASHPVCSLVKAPIPILADISVTSQTCFLCIWSLDRFYAWNDVTSWINEILKVASGVGLIRVKCTYDKLKRIQLFWFQFATTNDAATFRGIVARRHTTDAKNIGCDFIPESGFSTACGISTDGWSPEAERKPLQERFTGLSKSAKQCLKLRKKANCCMERELANEDHSPPLPLESRLSYNASIGPSSLHENPSSLTSRLDASAGPSNRSWKPGKGKHH
ncbi:hypothetical protein CPB84DRAFT_1847309 [Gymnopilus junonius]|uniref:Uncharacterized protein n=1 Tax=Gymnopilus junonius TaxID=109634 RepID=A0A9P5TNQ1_GYMJU|nr:hypothetical protein CPB84DRAFT_1847309 [Gymnopilus junonius]